MLKVIFRVCGQELPEQILVEAPPVISEAAALLWVLQRLESRGDAAIADWTADLASIRQQLVAAGVTDVTWEVIEARKDKGRLSAPYSQTGWLVIAVYLFGSAIAGCPGSSESHKPLAGTGASIAYLHR